MTSILCSASISLSCADEGGGAGVHVPAGRSTVHGHAAPRERVVGAGLVGLGPAPGVLAVVVASAAPGAA